MQPTSVVGRAAFGTASPRQDAQVDERALLAALVGPTRLQNGKTGRVVFLAGTLAQLLLNNQSERVIFVSLAVAPGQPTAVATYADHSDPSVGNGLSRDFAVEVRQNFVLMPKESLGVAVSVPTTLLVTQVGF